MDTTAGTPPIIPASEDSWFKELLSAFTGGVAAEFAFKAIVKLLTSFAEHTKEKVMPQAAEWIGLKLFGLKVVDEQNYNDALLLVAPTDRTRLHERLGNLTSAQNDYYRMTIMRPTADQIAAIITVHAQMEDAEWANFVTIMNLNTDALEALKDKFIKWMKAGGSFALATTKKVISEIRTESSQLTAKIEASDANKALDTTIENLLNSITLNLTRPRP